MCDLLRAREWRERSAVKRNKNIANDTGDVYDAWAETEEEALERVVARESAPCEWCSHTHTHTERLRVCVSLYCFGFLMGTTKKCFVLCCSTMRPWSFIKFIKLTHTHLYATYVCMCVRCALLMLFLFHTWLTRYFEQLRIHKFTQIRLLAIPEYPKLLGRGKWEWRMHRCRCGNLKG